MSLKFVPIFISSLLLLLISGFSVGGGGGGWQTTAVTDGQLDQAFGEMRKAVQAAESYAEKLAVCKDFLAKYPETKYTYGVLDDALWYIYQKGGDYDGAVAYAMEIRGKLSGNDASIVRGVDINLMELYYDAKRVAEFREIATRLDRQGGLIFTQYHRTMGMAIGLEAWDLVLDLYKSAEPMANAETFKSDYPDLERTEEEIQAAGCNRQGLMLTYRGWARAHLGQIDEALTDFAGADGLLWKNYFGFAYNELYYYWGKVLLEKGDAQGAIEKLAPAAFFGRQKDDFDPLRQAYIATGGEEGGFDDFLMVQRRKFAKTIDDFTLDDYGGQPRRFADLRGKVTLLNFWSPT